MADFNHLSRFEKFARELIEGSFDRLFGSKPMVNSIANELARAMYDNHSPKDNTVPARYTVFLNTKMVAEIERDSPDLTDYLIEYLNSLIRDLGFIPEEALWVEILCGEGLKNNEVIVETRSLAFSDNPTKIKEVEKKNLLSQEIESINAFLIINGKRHIPLDKPILSIGRQLDNDIVLDEPTVSRKHVQLRWRFGHYMIYDLGSRSGTFVNGDQITTYVLQTGDVIQLGAAAIIYGEEEQLDENDKPFRPSTRDGFTRELFRNE